MRSFSCWSEGLKDSVMSTGWEDPNSEKVYWNSSAYGICQEVFQVNPGNTNKQN